MANPEDLYMWASKDIDKRNFATMFVSNIMRGRSVVHKSEAAGAFAAVTGSDPTALKIPGTSDVVRASVILSAVQNSLDNNKRLEALTVKHFERDYPVFVPADPFAINKKAANAAWLHHVYEQIRYDDIVIESFGKYNELFVTTREIFVKHLDSLQISPALQSRFEQMYFAPSDSKNSGAVPRAINPEIMKQQDALIEEALYQPAKEDMKLSSSQRCYLRVVQLLHNNTNTNSPVDLRKIFLDMSTTDNIPYICLCDPINPMHKIMRTKFSIDGSVHGTLPSLLLKNWMDDSIKQTGVTQTLRIFVIYNNEKNAILTVDNTLSCELKYMFTLTDKAAIEDVVKSMSRLNDAIGLLRQVIPEETYLPLVDEDLLKGSIDGSVDNVTYASWLSTSKKTPSLLEFTSVAEALYPIFFVHSPSSLGGDTNEYVLQYKRHDNFMEEDLIHQYITANYRMDSTNMIEKMKELFTISEDQAQQIYQDWENKNKVELLRYGQRLFYRPKFWQGVHITIKRNGNVGMYCVVSGVNRMEQIERINNALRFCMIVAATKRKLPKIHRINANVVPAYDTGKKDIVMQDIKNLGIDSWQNSGDVDQDVDLELMAELEKEIKNVSAPSSVNVVSTDEMMNEDEKIPHRYLLHGLYSADRRLFPKGSYATICGKASQRQPIAINREEKEKIDKLFPKSYNGYVKVGSTPELKERNFYICPRIWCPKSRVSMSVADFDKNGKKCPFPDIQENPLILDSDSFWKGADHYPGVHDPKHHPDGLSMPCCFKQKNRGHKWLQQSDIPDGALSEEQNDRYIRTIEFPAQQGRFALLPPSLSAFLENTVCGNRTDGTGTITPKTRCFVRYGMPSSTQPFLNCVAHALEIKSVEELCKIIVEGIDIETFLSLNGGLTCRTFASIITKSDASFSEFKKWFVQQRGYIHKFHLEGVVSMINSSNKPFEDDVLREYTYYNSLLHFLNYIKDDRITKTPTHLLELFNLDIPLLNKPNGRKFMVFTVGESQGVTLSCVHAMKFDPRMHMFMIVRKGSIFEPVYFVKWGKAAKGHMESKIQFRLPNKSISMLMAYQRECMGTRVLQPQQLVMAFKAMDVSLSAQVIDGHCRLRGFLITNGMLHNQVVFIPMPPGNFSFIPNAKTDVLQMTVAIKKVNVKFENLKKILGILRDILSDFYTIKTNNGNDGQKNKERAVLLTDGTIVPLNSRNPVEQVIMAELILDQRIISRISKDDKRTIWLEDQLKKETLYQQFKTLVEKTIEMSPEAQDRLYYLKHEMNPLPLYMRARYLFHIFDKIKKTDIKNIYPRLKDRASRQILLGLPDQESVVLQSDVGINDTEAVFMQQDVMDKSASQLFQMIRTPETTTDLDIDRVVKEIASLSWQSIITTGLQMAELLNLQREVSPKALEGYGVYNIIPEATKCKKVVLQILSAMIAMAAPQLQMTPVRLEKLFETYVRRAYETGHKNDLIKGLSMNPTYSKAMKGKSTNVDSIIGVIQHPCYELSIFEVQVLCELLDVAVAFVAINKSGVTEANLVSKPDAAIAMVFCTASNASIDGIIVDERDRILMSITAYNHLSNQIGNSKRHGSSQTRRAKK
jgi:hypothetical protein